MYIHINYVKLIIRVVQRAGIEKYNKPLQNDDKSNGKTRHNEEDCRVKKHGHFCYKHTYITKMSWTRTLFGIKNSS